MEHIRKVFFLESNLPKPKIVKTKEEWAKILPKEAFTVCRDSSTERAFTGKFDKFYEKGVYKCVGCSQVLFKSSTKFNSGTGWPSFFEPATKDSIVYVKEKDYFYEYYEVKCSQCHCHLGHVFADGPKDKSGLRYCINSCCLTFEKE